MVRVGLVVLVVLLVAPPPPTSTGSSLGVVDVVLAVLLALLVVLVASRLTAAPCQRLGAGIDGGFLRGFGRGFLLDEGLTVGHRDLVVVGMDFVEGEEAVAVAAVLDEGGLQRRLHARHLGEIDVAA